MTYRIRENWRAIAVAGALLVAGGLFVCNLTPGCLFGPAAGSQPSAHADPTDGTAVSGGIPTPRRIEHADEATFEQRVLGSDVPVLVDFYADWCVPCQTLAPTLEQLARELPDAKIVKVNVDQNPRLAARYRISSIPNLLVFNNGQITAEHTGLASKDQLRALLER
jgi:thioredoxin 1